MGDLWHRLSDLAGDIIFMAISSALVTPAVVFVVPGAQKSVKYILGMFIFGIVGGVIAHQAPFLPDWTEWLAVLVVAVCGPFTVAKFHGKTVPEAIAEMMSIRRNGGDDENN